MWIWKKRGFRKLHQEFTLKKHPRLFELITIDDFLRALSSSIAYEFKLMKKKQYEFCSNLKSLKVDLNSLFSRAFVSDHFDWMLNYATTLYLVAFDSMIPEYSPFKVSFNLKILF